MVNKKATVAGSSDLGCFYTTLGCGFAGSISNSSFNTVATSIIQYTSSMFFIGFDKMILRYSGSATYSGEF